MKRSYQSIPLLSIAVLVLHYQSRSQLEITPYFRIDKYQDIKSPYSTESPNYLTLMGRSRIIFHTDKYWYHTVSTGISAEKVFPTGKNGTLTSGVMINNYVLFKEYYHLASNADGSQDIYL